MSSNTLLACEQNFQVVSITMEDSNSPTPPKLSWHRVLHGRLRQRLGLVVLITTIAVFTILHFIGVELFSTHGSSDFSPTSSVHVYEIEFSTVTVILASIFLTGLVCTLLPAEKE